MNWMRNIILVTVTNMMISFAYGEELSLGSTQAPVTLVEYGSLTCDYCISFHRNVLPRVKKHYINAGKVRFIYRHFPTSETAKHGAVAAECAGEKFYDMLEVLYSSVADWYQAENRESIFVQQATSLGLNSASYLSCLRDTKHLDNIESQQRAARKDLDVSGTPTFVINGEFIRGKKSFIEIKNLIGEALNKDK